MPKKFLEYIKRRTVSYDFRSLALWRILTGIAVLYDLIFYKLLFLEKYYFSEALRPESTLNSFFGNGFGLIEALGTTGFTVFVYLSVLLALFYTVGLFDKLVKPVLFLCYSLIVVNSLYLLNGFHFMILVSVFWSIFLPTGIVWSLSKTKEVAIHPLAVYGLYLQIAFIYLTGALLKNGAIWTEGSAIELIVQDEYYASNFAFILRDVPETSKMLTYTSLIWEFLIPIFILWPFYKNLKGIAAMMIVMLHIGIAMLVQVGPFLIIGTAFSAALLPRQFWERLKFLKIKKVMELPLVSIRKTINHIKTFVLLVLILMMIKGNLRYWYTGSYVSSLMQAVPNSYDLFYKRYIPSFVLYGFKDQPWVFFQMDAQDDLGLFVIVEEDESGVFTLNGTEIKKNSTGTFILDQSKFKNGFEHDLQHADFNYMVSLKGVSDLFPESVYKELLMDHQKQVSQKKQKTLSNLYLCYLSKKSKLTGSFYEYDYKLDCLYELNLKKLENK
jgi:hypothetical protein